MLAMACRRSVTSQAAKKRIDRGLAYICGGDVGGGEHGCGLFFCGNHMFYYAGTNADGEHAPQLCDVCLINFRLGADNYKLFAARYEPTPDVPVWLRHKLRHHSWAQWRAENPEEVKSIRNRLTPQPDNNGENG